MRNESNAWMLSRRTALTLAGAALVPWKDLQASEFWDKKDPSQWTGDEIDRLTTKSPWAKSVTAQYAPGSNNGGYGQRGGGGNGGGMGGGPRIGIGGIGMGRRGGGMGQPGGGYPQSSNYKGTVRWESAQPILDALKTPLPDAFAKYYTIGVRDIPLIANQPRQSQQNPDDTDRDSPRLSRSDSSDSDANANKRMLDDLKTSTTLTPKGREAAQPELVKQMTPGGTYFIFGFSKIFLDFGKKDHEVDFSTQLGKLIVKAKFDPSEMLYHGQLAV
jgi:hypothetical protein